MMYSDNAPHFKLADKPLEQAIHEVLPVKVFRHMQPTITLYGDLQLSWLLGWEIFTRDL